MKVLIDLFCGAGGFSEGGINAGFDKVIGVDFWDKALELHKLNHPSSTCLHMSLGKDHRKTFETIIACIILSYKVTRVRISSPKDAFQVP